MPKNRKTRKEKEMSLNRQNTSVNRRVFVKTASPADDKPSYTIAPLTPKTTENYTLHLTSDLIKTTTLSVSVIIGELILFYVLQMHK
jgi:hypothetical protein